MKNKIFLVTVAIIVFVIGFFIIVIKYNNPENVKARGIKNCIKHKYEYRSVVYSNGVKKDFCIINGKETEIK